MTSTFFHLFCVKFQMQTCTLSVMELSSKSKIIKKKHKKKKNRVPDNVLLPLISIADGVCNWSALQKVMGSEKNDLKKESVNNKTNQCSLENKQTYSQALISNLNLKNDNVAAISKKSGKKLDCESHSMKKNPEQDQNQPHKFNFSSSVNNSPKKKSPEKIKKSKYSEKKLTKAVAMDCEMVGTGPNGESSIIARVSIVNSFGVCLYDEFVKPKEKVTDFRTSISGVRPSDLKNGKDLFQVQKDVLNIIDGRILVGHSIKHDLDVLFISHPRHLIRDTSLYKPFRDLSHGRTPSLKKLTSMILGCEIQSGEHSSIEDAQAAMLLYLRQKKEWESQVKAQRKRKPRVFENSSFKLN